MLQQIRGHQEFSNASEGQKNFFDAWKGQPTDCKMVVNFHKDCFQKPKALIEISEFWYGQLI